MPAVVSLLLSVIVDLAMSLVAKTFVRKTIILVLERLVKMTETDLDDQVLAAAREAWEEKPESK